MFQQTLKDFSINFNALNERNTLSSGALLTGQVSFTLTKETKITSITMKVVGKVHVHWTSGSKRSRRNVNAKLELFNLRNTIMQEGGAVSSKLPPGRHVYPFTCQLPHGDFPTSFRGAFGQVTYTMNMSVSRSWHLDKDFTTELKFVNHIDMNRPHLWAPLSGVSSKTLCCLWCAEGPITMSARTEKQAFLPGETVRIFCDFSNASSRAATPMVKLQQKQSFFTHNRGSARVVDRCLGAVKGRPLNPHVSDARMEMLLTVPADAPSTISNCSLLVVEYTIKLSLCIRASANLVMLFPIILYEPPAVPRHQPYL